MIKRILLSAILFASLVTFPQPANAQTAEPAEFDTLTIDTDPRTDRVGLVDPATGIWNLRGAGGALTSFFYGDPGDFPMAGDWDCDGIDTPGLYRQSDGFVYLRNSNSQGVADIRFFFGNPGDIPLAGDFDNDGCDTVSIYRASEARIYIINELGANDGGLGAADFNYIFGNPGDKPFVGDFDGDGIDTIGLHRESTGFVYFRQTHTQGIANAEFFFGDPGDRLVAGDWGILDNIETPAVFRPSNTTFFFRHTNTQGNADQSLVWGISSFLPIAGRWKLSDTPPAPTASGPLTPALISFPYSATLTKIGGLNPLVVEKISGPAWIKVSAAGVVSGTAPATTGAANFGVRITDRRGLSTTATIPLQVVTGCQGATQLPANQCQALVNLFKTTKGYGWSDREAWLTGDPCEWNGIECVGNNVTAIELDENNLTGPLPSLAALTGLTILDLGVNALGGGLSNVTTLPTTLQVLDLGDNGFSGGIPGALFSTFTSLTQLDLDGNNLSGSIPSTINLAALVSFNLSSNLLSGAIPPQIGNLTAVQDLDLSDNRLQGPVPSAIQSLPNLNELVLNGNFCLTAAPASFQAFLTGHDPEWNDGC